MTQNGLKWILNTTLKIVTFCWRDLPPPIITFVTIFFFLMKASLIEQFFSYYFLHKSAKDDIMFTELTCLLALCVGAAEVSRCLAEVRSGHTFWPWHALPCWQSGSYTGLGIRPDSHQQTGLYPTTEIIGTHCTQLACSLHTVSTKLAHSLHTFCTKFAQT